MDYFDMTYFMISRREKDLMYAWNALSDNLKERKKEIIRQIAKEAVTKVKIFNGVLPMQRLGKNVETVTSLVNTRIYGNHTRSVNLDMVHLSYLDSARTCPDYDNHKHMNKLCKQIKSYKLIMNKSSEMERAKNIWAKKTAKRKNIKFNQIHTGHAIDTQTAAEYNNILKLMAEKDKHLKAIAEKKEKRETELGRKYTDTVYDTCSLCLDEGRLVKINCHGQHAFHPQCVTDLFYDSVKEWDKGIIVKCPLCRMILN